MPLGEIFCRVTGRVQMVMFRDFVQRQARSFSLTGWVKNEPDGSVNVLAQGDKEALDKFIRKLRKGSLLARVESVVTEERTPEKQFQDFEIVY